jgi:hypothetical protein
VLELALDDPGDPEGVHYPEEGDEHCVHHEHYRLFIDDTVRVRVVVLLLDGLHCQGHDGSGEEQA